jgi:hypothetical protein
MIGSTLTQILFVITTFATMYGFHHIVKNKWATAFMLLQFFLQGAIAFSGFYLNESTLPPRFVLAVLPAFLLIGYAFFSESGKLMIANLDLKALTYLHLIRVPVEIALLWLFFEKLVPIEMTFEGRNFDILSGITAPIIGFWVFKNHIQRKRILLIWNVLCLLLLINIVATAILCAPTPLQQLAFEQPNIAIFSLPFVWLPSVVVPIVLFAHLVAIYRRNDYYVAWVK